MASITIVNNGSTPVSFGAAGRSVAAGASATFTNRTADEYRQLVANLADGNDVIVSMTMEEQDYPAIICKIKTPADPGSGIGTQAANGFDLEDFGGVAVNVQPEMYFGVFDDEDFTTPAANATLDTAAAGTIDAGAGTNLLEVTPDATGVLSVTLTDATDETVYCRAWPKTTATRVIDCSEYHTTPFIP